MRNRTSPRGLAVAIGLCLSTFGGALLADDGGANQAAAQALFDEAKQLLARGNTSEACPKFEESQRLDPASGTLINLGDCYEREGKLARAWSTFLQAASSARSAGRAEREQVARDRAVALERRLPKIVIQVPAGDTSDLEIQRDGVPVGKAQWGTPIPVDFGTHVVAASVAGRNTWQATVTVRTDGETVPIVVPTATAAVAPRSPARRGLGPRRSFAIAAGAVGVAGLAMGSVFGLVSKSKHDEADGHCAAWACRDQQGVELRAQAIRAGTWSTVGFVVGTTALAGAGVLWFARDRDATEGTGAAIGIGAGNVTLATRW
jgi:hypothetical protein